MLPPSTIGVLQADIDAAAPYKVGDGDLEAFGVAQGRWFDKLQLDPALYWLIQRHGLVPQSTAGYVTSMAALAGQDPALTASPDYPLFQRLLGALNNVINRGDVQAQMNYIVANTPGGYAGLANRHVLWAPYLEDAIQAEFSGVPWVPPNVPVATSSGGGSYNLAPQAPPQPAAGYPLGVQFLATMGGVNASYAPAAWYIVGFRRVTVYDKLIPEGGNTRYSDWQQTPARWNIRRPNALTDNPDPLTGLWGVRPADLEPSASWAVNLQPSAAQAEPAAVLQAEAAFLSWLQTLLPNVVAPPEWRVNIEPIGTPGLSPNLQGTGWVDIAIPPDGMPAPTLSGAIRPVSALPTGGSGPTVNTQAPTTPAPSGGGATGASALTGAMGAQTPAPAAPTGPQAAKALFDWRIWAVVGVVIVVVLAMAKRRR